LALLLLGVKFIDDKKEIYRTIKIKHDIVHRKGRDIKVVKSSYTFSVVRGKIHTIFYF